MPATPAAAPRRRSSAVRRDLDFPAISIRQPFADLIVFGVKDIENRSRNFRFRGNILVHASLRPEKDVLDRLTAEYRKRGHDYRPAFGAIIGMVRIVDCVQRSASEWFVGPYGLVLADPVEFRKPIPCSGKLGIFRVPREALRGTRAFAAVAGS